MIKNSIFKKIGASIALLVVAFLGSIVINSHINNALSATIPLPVASFSTSLTSGITSTATSMTLVSITSDDGVTLTNGATYGFVIDEGSASEEYVIGTLNTADNTVTGMTRGVSTLTGNTAVTTLQKTHRRGASVKITDHPVLTVLTRVVNGTETLPNALTYASGVGPINSSDITDKEYVLSVVSGGSVSFEKVVVAGTAGETIAAGNVVYLKASDGYWWKADADDLATLDGVQLGIAQGSGTASNAISNGVLLRGLDANNTGTAGSSVYISNTAGGVSTSAGTNSRIIGQYKPSSGGLYFDPVYSQTVTVREKAAISGGSTFGTPSSTNKFITQEYNSSATGLPTIQTFTAQSTTHGDNTTRYDITNPSGTTFRYTYDTVGTDPGITDVTFPIGSHVLIESTVLNSNNTGYFAVTGSGTRYFEVTNASGVAENDKVITDGYVRKATAQTYTKPANVKYIKVELQGGGAGGQGAGVNSNFTGVSGGSGAYAQKQYATASLSATETIYVGLGGYSESGNSTSGKRAGSPSIFKSVSAGGASTYIGGTATGGDINISGQTVPSQTTSGASTIFSHDGGHSMFGWGARGVSSDNTGIDASAYGAGGSASAMDSSSSGGPGGNGADGIIIITEYYS